MLRFLYQGKYNDARPTAALLRENVSFESDGRGGLKFSPSMRLREKAMVVNVKLYVMADKYNMPALKQHARAKYKGILYQVAAVVFNQSGLEDIDFEYLFSQSALGDIEFECSVHCLQKNQ